MTKLNQIIAVQKGVQASTARAITDAYHKFQKTQLFGGLSRTYRPKDEEGELLPGESVKVQLKAEEVLTEATQAFTQLIDVVLTKDQANREATAPILVDGYTIAVDVPVSTLLFLEKQLADVRTMIGKIPVLDPAETWHYDSTADCWRAEDVQTARTKKIPRNHVKAEATDRHPAQVEVYNEDVVVGLWTKTTFSGAMPASRVRELSERVTALQTAVKYAREQANSIDILQQKMGEGIFTYILHG
jgi:hypothetical protein